MSTTGPLYARALDEYRAGDRHRAERLCWEVLNQEPLHADTIFLLGVLELDAGQPARAILHFHHTVLLRPAHAPFHHALGEAYRAHGDRDEAANCFHEALRLDPAHAAAHHDLGRLLMDRGQFDSAAASIRCSLALNPNQPRAQTNLGQALHRQGDLVGAIACFTEALRLKPDYAIPHNNLGVILHEQGKFADATAALRRAMELQPNYPEAHCNLGNVLRACGDPAAVNHYREAIRLRPEYLKAHCYLGTTLAAHGYTTEALASLQNALRIKPDYVEAIEALGHVLLNQARWEDALAVFEKLLRLQPDHDAAFASSVRIRELLCDWGTRAADFERLRRGVEHQLALGRRSALTPFNTMTLPWPAELHLAVARGFSDDVARTVAPLGAELNFAFSPGHPDRLRIGYIGGTFHDHALVHLMQGVFGLHDRAHFEVFVYSYGPDDGSLYRRRVQADCDHFRDLAALSTTDSARRIHADGIHILVDVMGHTGRAREEIVALRPAPVQVSYIGFAGSMGASFIDYLISDRTVTPPDHAGAYSEKLVLLPHCYLATDHEQQIASGDARRADFGLPENGFVFACFNNSYKFEPRIFDVWMKILVQVPDSVLWLFSGGATVERNLRREAEARGIASARIVFAGHLPKGEHLARLPLADLFLDTHYVNAHTGACDALWTGLPVLTCPGATFAARVAASLVTNIGLPELLAEDLGEYEQRAVHLARHPEELGALRTRLVANRTGSPLFDTPGLVRNLERAYRAMWEIFAAGEPPRPITVTEPVG